MGFWKWFFFFFTRFLFFQVKRAMTMTEKILARASERSKLEPGENVWVNVDVLMTHDVCGPGTIGIFKKEFGENSKVLLDSPLFSFLLKECNFELDDECFFQGPNNNFGFFLGGC